MLPGERRRERVLSWAEEKRYLQEAPPLLHDVATILIDCGLRPEECFRLKWESRARRLDRNPIWQDGQRAAANPNV
jgi:integrase